MPIGDNSVAENAYMVDENGNAIGKITSVETVTMAVTEDDVQSFSIPNSFCFSAKWKSDKTSRKAFCRELVSLGFTKSEAKAVARAIRGNYGQHLALIRLGGTEYAKELIGGKK